MTCPVCDEKLREVQKHGVSVDICPGCKGVWLDRGELEKIIEMAGAGGPGSEVRNDKATSQHGYEEPRRAPRDHDSDDHRDQRDHDDHGHDQGYGQKKRKSSWLGDILGGLGGD